MFVTGCIVGVPSFGVGFAVAGVPSLGVGFVVVGAPSLGVGFAVIIDVVGRLDGNDEPFCQPSSSQTSRLLLLLLLLLLLVVDDESLLALADVTDSLLDLLCFVVVVLSDELSS